jgi:phosphate transport system substrate-binding protein
MKLKHWSLAAVAALALPLAACGGDSSSNGSNNTNNGSSGRLFISGSSTVEPISTAVAKAFNADNPDIAIQVEGPGTGDGFAKFCAGETDIQNASRAIKAAEVETCEANGIEFIELKVAIDGLSVITSVNNTAVECVSFSDLWVLLGPDAIGRNKWSDANTAAAELKTKIGDKHGVINAPYPDAKLTVTAPGEESGTYDSFVEIVLGSVAKSLQADDDQARPDYTASPNDNVIIEGIAANNTSLGWVGYAFVEENLNTIKPLKVDAGKGCVEATSDTIASGEFPIARALYIYVNKAKTESNPALSKFVDYYLSDAGLGVIGSGPGQVPYVSLAAADQEATRAAWAAKTVGTRDGGK